MKNLLYLCSLILAICFFSCQKTANSIDAEINNDSISPVDSLSLYLQRIDSINNSGELRHLHVYELGKLKSIFFKVYQLESSKDTMEYIILKKDCGGEYYYSWVETPLLLQEVKYFIDAIDTVAYHYDRKVDHEERYIYITKRDIRLFSENDNSSSNKWSVSLSVDYNRSNSHINITKEELNELKLLLKKGEEMILDLKRKRM